MLGATYDADASAQMARQNQYAAITRGAPATSTMGRRPPVTQDPAAVVALNRNQLELQAAQLAADASRYGSEQAAGANRYQAEQQAGAQRYGAEQQAGASRYGADTNLRISQGEQATSRYSTDVGARTQREVANIQAQADRFPVEQQMRRFDAVFPLLSGAASGFGQSQPQNYSAILSSMLGAMQPSVYSPELLQARINSENALLHQGAQSDIKQLGQQFGGRGWSGNNSGAMAELAGRSLAAARSGSMRNALAAQQEYATQQDDFGSRQSALLTQLLGQLIGSDTSRYAADQQARSSLLSALGGLV